MQNVLRVNEDSALERHVYKINMFSSLGRIWWKGDL
jgi:hypothetical protein